MYGFLFQSYLKRYQQFVRSLAVLHAGQYDPNEPFRGPKIHPLLYRHHDLPQSQDRVPLTLSTFLETYRKHILKRQVTVTCHFSGRHCDESSIALP